MPVCLFNVYLFDHQVNKITSTHHPCGLVQIKMRPGTILHPATYGGSQLVRHDNLINHMYYAITCNNIGHNDIRIIDLHTITGINGY